MKLVVSIFKRSKWPGWWTVSQGRFRPKDWQKEIAFPIENALVPFEFEHTSGKGRWHFQATHEEAEAIAKELAFTLPATARVRVDLGENGAWKEVGADEANPPPKTKKRKPFCAVEKQLTDQIGVVEDQIGCLRADKEKFERKIVEEEKTLRKLNAALRAVRESE